MERGAIAMMASVRGTCFTHEIQSQLECANKRLIEFAMVVFAYNVEHHQWHKCGETRLAACKLFCRHRGLDKRNAKVCYARIILHMLYIYIRKHSLTHQCLHKSVKFANGDGEHNGAHWQQLE